MLYKLMFLEAITPVHAGVSSNVGAVADLPVAREVSTQWPILPSSSIKGVFKRRNPNHPEWFGTPDKAGELMLTDARLLLLPVQSFWGSFAYITCEAVLRRLQTEASALGASITLELPKLTGATCATAASSQCLNSQHVVLGDIELECIADCDLLEATLSQLIFGDANQAFKGRLVLVSNEVYSHFSVAGMQIQSRIKLEDNSKTVVDASLWWEEHVPACAVFSAFAVSNVPQSLEAVQHGQVVQIGGKATVGKGLLKIYSEVK